MQRAPSHTPSNPQNPLAVDLTGEDRHEGAEFEGFEDGPLIHHPGEIVRRPLRQTARLESASIRLEDHRLSHRAHSRHLAQEARPIGIYQVLQMPRSVDMTMLAERCNDKNIAYVVERWYIHAELYVSASPLSAWLSDLAAI